ncbi:MAG: hypothetical protein HKL80_01350 [Acidimicrobiales bacterium]|nr:hypothetical protein [Acidimicrobiales bacterium]
MTFFHLSSAILMAKGDIEVVVLCEVLQDGLFLTCAPVSIVSSLRGTGIRMAFSTTNPHFENANHC